MADDWTAMQVKEHLLSLLAAHELRQDERFGAQEKAIHVNQNATEEWRQNANEWRATLTEREVKFITQTEANVQFRALQDRLTKLENYRADTEGRGQGMAKGWSLLLGVVGLLLTLLAIGNLAFSMLRGSA